MKGQSEFSDDLVHRIDNVNNLLQEGHSLDEAVCLAFCIDFEDARNFTGRVFAELYAELMAYDRHHHRL